MARGDNIDEALKELLLAARSLRKRLENVEEEADRLVRAVKEVRAEVPAKKERAAR